MDPYRVHFPDKGYIPHMPHHKRYRSKHDVITDLLERHELFLLGDDEKKVTYVQETRGYPQAQLHCDGTLMHI